jgi:hypothetical protein
MNKYQHALDELQKENTWRQIGAMLGEAIGDKVHGSDAWNVWQGKSSSWKVELGLELLGLVEPPRKRIRLAVEFENEEQRQRYKDFYGIDGEQRTFTDHIFIEWITDTTIGKVMREISNDAADEKES